MNTPLELSFELVFKNKYLTDNCCKKNNKGQLEKGEKSALLILNKRILCDIRCKFRLEKLTLKRSVFEIGYYYGNKSNTNSDERLIFHEYHRDHAKKYNHVRKYLKHAIPPNTDPITVGRIVDKISLYLNLKNTKKIIINIII